MEAKHNPYRDNPNRTKCEELIYDQGYEAGIREVVEWLEKHATESIAVKDSDTSQEMNIRAISENEWQTKLKEWGL